MTPDPFITNQDLVSFLGRGGTADAGITIAVDAACDIVRTASEQTFNQVFGGTARLDGTGTDCLLLPEFPVTAAGTVSVNGTAITDYTLSDNGMLFRGTVGLSNPYWSDEVPFPRVWPVGRQNVRVTYDHGYGTADFPTDLRMVALGVASRLVVQGAAVEESLGDARVKYAGPAMDLTNTEKMICRKYRRHR